MIFCGFLYDFVYFCGMIINELTLQIRQSFQLEPTPEQALAIDVFCQFMTSRENHAVMILRGSAGTGKTSLAGAIVIYGCIFSSRSDRKRSLRSGLGLRDCHACLRRERQVLPGLDCGCNAGNRH